MSDGNTSSSSQAPTLGPPTMVSETQAQGPEQAVNALQEAADDTKGSIINLLSTYPYISGTMIQVGIGPACPPKLWRPILEQMVAEGIIIKREESVLTHRGRSIVRQVYHLSNMPYPPLQDREVVVVKVAEPSSSAA